MKRTYKLQFSFVVIALFLVLFYNPIKAVEYDNSEKQSMTRSVKALSWYMVAGQKTYTTSFYVDAGDSIQITVTPSVSSAKYSVGILQPSGSERKITKSGNSTTTYAVSTSGYYKVFIHNVTSSALDYNFVYAY